jgi:erythromycin esterase-like protein
MTNAVDTTRERLGRAIFATWDERDVEELVRLMRKFADAVTSLSFERHSEGAPPDTSIENGDKEP